MNRDDFRNGVFQRDNHRCVICGSPAQDAHHIMERRLFPNGGYYLDNGASLCGKCHIKAEQTEISTDEIRKAAGIENIILPPHLYADVTYDKWGNVILSDSSRLMGELFDDPSVQKILSGVMHLFTRIVKYPRTYHLPWSPSVSSDDRLMQSLEKFEGEEIVVTEKMDGENTTIYAPDGMVHARSPMGSSHPSQSWVRNQAPYWVYDLDNRYRLCGENLYAVHSIRYDNLPSYFLGFSLWDGLNCLSWDDTQEYFDLIGVHSVPVLWRGNFSREALENLKLDFTKQEGYVIRVARAFHMREFSQVIGKFVRPNHVATTVHHWKLHWSGDRNNLRGGS